MSAQSLSQFDCLLSVLAFGFPEAAEAGPFPLGHSLLLGVQQCAQSRAARLDLCRTFLGNLEQPCLRGCAYSPSGIPIWRILLNSLSISQATSSRRKL